MHWEKGLGMKKRDFLLPRSVHAQTSPARAKPEDYDGVVIPGGHAPDKLRRHPAVLSLVRESR